MKITIDINTNQLLSNLTEDLTEALRPRLEDDVRKLVSAKVKEDINKQVGEWVAEALEEPLTQTDQWGQVVKHTSFRELVIEQAKNYLAQMVGRNGEVNSWGRDNTMQRKDWIAINAAKQAVEKTLEPELKQIVENAKKQIAKEAGEIISKTICKLAST